MTKIQLGSGASSSTTHHLTQSSQTIDRRSVIRPSNLAIEEAARTTTARTDDFSSARPSRLVNLRVHAADLIQAQAEPQTTPSSTADSQPIVPHVVELGTIDRAQAADLPPVDLSRMVPEEAPVEEITSYTPAIINPPVPPAAPTSEMVLASNSSMVAAPEINSQDLAMNIAADYATANLGAVEAADNSIDTIARATSEAIAAIRTATDPAEIAEQVTSLQAFADNIKASSAAPEMVELSNTIEKFIQVAMKSTKVQEEVQKKATKQAAQQKAIEKKSAPKVTAVKKPTVTHTTTPKVASRTATRSAATRPATPKRATRTTARTAPKLVADEDRALRTALRNVAAMDDEPETKPLKAPVARKRGTGKRLVLAFFCAVACVAAIVYFIGSNIPDISVKVAALQTGIEASYPSYVPRDYSLSDISSEDGKITMTFKGPEQSTFTLTEEKSSWDSTALLRNFVEPTWQSNYVTTHEQGITIYISGANAAWVNGGVLYKITATSNSLTKKQLRNIVTSM